MSTETYNTSNYLEAPINYLEHGDEKPVTYLYEPPAGVPIRSGRTTKHWMKVRNGHVRLPGFGIRCLLILCPLNRLSLRRFAERLEPSPLNVNLFAGLTQTADGRPCARYTTVRPMVLRKLQRATSLR